VPSEHALFLGKIFDSNHDSFYLATKLASERIKTARAIGREQRGVIVTDVEKAVVISSHHQSPLSHQKK